jgi:hypothetical protein
MIECLECGKKLKVIKHTHLKFKCTGKLKNVAEYLTKYPNALTVSPEISEKIGKGNTLAGFIEKYGSEEGEKRFNQYRKKLSDKNSFENMSKKRNWTFKQWDEYNKSRGITEQNLIKKYGEEEGKKRFSQYCEKQKDAGNSLKYFVEKYGEDEGSQKYQEVCKLKGITLENMIRVHGTDKGLIKYHKWLESTKGNFISLTASQFIKDITDELPDTFIFHDGIYSKEFCIYNERPFLFDFVITDPIKLCIEFNGDFWHANPKVYKKDDIIPLRGGSLTAGEIWTRDAHKLNLIKNRGFEVLVIWENDYLSDRKNTIKRVQECIQSLS